MPASLPTTRESSDTGSTAPARSPMASRVELLAHVETFFDESDVGELGVYAAHLAELLRGRVGQGERITGDVRRDVLSAIENLASSMSLSL